MATINHRSTFIVLLILAGLISIKSAGAQQEKPMLDRSKLSIGVGFADNSVGNIDKTGIQIFAAYDLDQVNVMQGVKSAVEFGFADFGFRRDSTGLWGNYVVEGGIDEGFSWLARAGIDIGDDSGLMFGVGIGYRFEQQKQFRVEYIARDDVDSLQFNLLFGL